MTHERPLVRVWVCSGHSQRAGKTLPQLVARMSEARCGSVMSVWHRPRISLRSSGLLSEIRSGRHSPRRRGIQYAAPLGSNCRLWNTGSSGQAGRRRRRLGHPFCPSFGIAAGRKIRLEQDRNAVPATNRQWFWLRIWQSKGSGNADSQRKVRGSGWSGQGCLHVCPCDSGCDRAHPASWRASASYRPLRAVWAFAPGHSGVLSEITRPFSAR